VDVAAVEGVAAVNGFEQLWGLPVLLTLAAVWRWRVTAGRSLAEALLDAAAIVAAGIWVIGNLLSFVDLFRPEVLRIGWSIVGAGAIFQLWRGRSQTTPRLPRPVNLTEWSLLAGVVGLLGLTLVRALLAPPNTVDVLNYHLPRQVMWLQHGNLAPWFTVNDRQLMMPPLAEMIGAQFLALTGDDYWANLPQWAAYAGLALALAVLVRRLGGSRAVAGVAALLGLLLPMAYHEATNAKNDLLSAFWITAGAAELARWQEERFPATRATAAWLVLPLTLAWLTKSTAMLFVPPLVVAGLWAWSRRHPWRGQFHVFAPAALLALLLVLPFHARNLAWYGTPLGRHRAEDGGALMVEAMGPRLFASNALRHASLHLASPWRAWNEAWLGFVARAHRVLGVDENDRRTTLWVLRFEPSYAPDDETIAGAPAHFLLGLPWLCALAVGFRRRKGGAEVRWLAGATLGGAVLFLATLKWQPWAPRLELPLFALGTAAVVASAAAWSRALARGAATLALIAAAVVWSAGADTMGRTLWQHPRLTEMARDLNYYRVLPRLAQRDFPLTDLIERSGARHVMIQSVHDIPYPLMRRLRQRLPDIQFVGTAEAALHADAIIALSLGAPFPLYADYAGRRDWRLVGAGFGDGVYLPEARVRALGWSEQLPQFAGWSRHDGVPLADRDLPGLGRTLAREMPSGSGRLTYDSIGRPMRLRAVVRRLANAETELRVTVAMAGHDFAVVDCGREAAREFEVQLPRLPGRHVIELRLAGAEPRAVVFTRLQVIDLPENPATDARAPQ